MARARPSSNPPPRTGLYARLDLLFFSFVAYALMPLTLSLAIATEARVKSI